MELSPLTLNSNSQQCHCSSYGNGKSSSITNTGLNIDIIQQQTSLVTFPPSAKTKNIKRPQPSYCFVSGAAAAAFFFGAAFFAVAGLAFFAGAAFFLAEASADAAFGFVGFAAVVAFFFGAVAFFAGAGLGAAFSFSVVDAWEGVSICQLH